MRRHCVQLPERLNARGAATARGGVWTPVQVTAVLRRTLMLKLDVKQAPITTCAALQMPLEPGDQFPRKL
jgi:hypothetical protein